ncbi:MAG: riboflavin synthase, alpha subunit [Xanthobacteraceae bacterium]|nr:riboflavin synthase, alpha subunit [Xanthobacteraceae bacterium]
MFTGIVTDIGTLRRVEPRNDVRRLTIASRYDTATIELGASIACSGVCLTVVALQPDAFEVEAAPETLAVTTGHVDGVATVIAREDIGETTRFVFDVPDALAPFIAVKGSVTLDGTSLTVNEVEGTRFSCLLIPHTLAHTTWGDVQAGDHVNIEVDMMARYAARLAEFR